MRAPSPDPDSFATLVDVLRFRAEHQEGALLYRFLETGDVDGPTQEWTFSHLDRLARGIGAMLQEAGATGERALLLFPPGLEFVSAFMGCLYAGVVAVPVYPPEPGRLERTLPRLRAIAQDCGARYVLTTSFLREMAEVMLPQAPELASLTWLATDATTDAQAEGWRKPDVGANTLAFLQYTSGSTGTPKGVMLSHANILHNERLIRRGFGHDAKHAVGMGWLPVFHDMGLIGNVLQPLYLGFPCTLMSPIAFLQRPLRWLEAVSHYGATTSGGPNFAYDLCVRKVTPDVLERLDLSRWTVAFNGAEPTRAETLRRFTETFAPRGFRPQAFYPCYGLAEATLIVTGGTAMAGVQELTVDSDALAHDEARKVAPEDAGARVLVSVGRSAEDQQLRILHPETRTACAPGTVGEICVAGPSVALGYWNRPEESERAFGTRLEDGSGPWLRTGDLGFVLDGELFVTGRLKDLIILRGRNLYPQDIELTAERAHPAVRPGCTATFSVDVEGEERLVLVTEADLRASPTGAVGVIEAIRGAIADEHAAQVHAVVLVEPRTIPKTSSGKIQRRACRDAFLQGTLEVVEQAVAAPAESAPQESASEVLAPLREVLPATPEGERAERVEAFVRAEVARASRAAPASLSRDVPLAGLGLDSLAVMELQGRLEASLGTSVPATFLWEHPTLAAVSSALLATWERSQLGTVVEGPALRAGPLDGDLPLSPGQFRLWFLDRLMPGVPLYNVQFGLRMEGALDTDALQRALDALVRRHAILRTVFPEVNGEPRQRVLSPAPLSLGRHDLTAVAAEAREQALREHALALGQRPFSLTEGPLFHAELVRLTDTEHVLLLTQHHLITDGWSIGVLAGELAALHGAFARGAADPLAPPALHYADYARWQRALVPTLAAQRTFWARGLNALPRLELPTDHARPREQGSRGATVTFQLPRDLTDSLRALGQREGCTLYVTLLTAYAALLHRYTGQEDFGVGTVAAHRERTAVRELIGFLANTLVIRCDLSGGPTFQQLLKRVREQVREALTHGELPFEEVVAATNASRSGDGSPLVQTSFMLESLPAVTTNVPGMRWRPELSTPDGAVAGTSKFDLSLVFAEGPDGLAGALEFRTDLFEEATIRRLVGHLEVLLRGVVDAPGLPVGALALLTGLEQQQVLEEWNHATDNQGGVACIHEQFLAQAQETPDAIAVVHDNESLTYAQLRRRVGVLAARLRALGVGPEARVGISVERSLDTVVSLLGILEAGGAYVPLDPDYPRERLLYMLRDCGAKVLVTQSHLAGALAGPDVTEVLVDALEDGPTLATLGRSASPSNVAYVIYTSGSTGQPKGVMVPHETVARFFAAMDQRLDGTNAGAWLAVTSISFDISVLELLWTLTRGFKVVLQGDEAATLRARRRKGSVAKPLDFSLFYFADDSDQPGDRYRLLMEGAKFADRNGFAAIWTPERHFHAFGGLYPNPSVTGAAVAAVTERVGIRAGSVVLPLHHPVRVAEEWSLVDNLSRGRVGMSIASGWHADDFVFAPERYAKRKEVMMESLDVIRRLWAGETVRYPGGAGTPVDVQLRPRPVQRELPVWLTAAGNPETFRAAGAAGAFVLTHLLGQGLEELGGKIALYREAWRAAGHSGEGHVTLMLHTYVDNDAERVKARVEGPFKAYLRSSLDLMSGIGRSLGMDVDAKSLRPEDLDRIVTHAFDRYFETSGLFGTPRGCLAMVERVRELGVNELGCLIDFGIDADAVLENLPALDQLRRLAERDGRRSSDVPTLPEQLRRHGITHFQCTPSHARALTLDTEAVEALSGLRRMLVGGEALPTALANTLQQAVPGGVVNMYGPTETTVWSSTHDVREATGPVPIGRPIARTRMYVLNRFLQPLPAGVPGELFLAGGGVTRGYHARPSLTAERFVPDPFSQEPGARMYRTGDLARWRADGTVEFLGRVDHQVKVRGFRIETGEVETALSRHSGVREAVVVAREDSPGDAMLVAYVVGTAETVPESSVLRAFLQQHLPEHMVPSLFVAMERLPLTPNGKVDRKALPAPSQARRDTATTYAAPRGQLEERIAGVWREVLRLERVGIHDSFFDLGGHSLQMVQVHHRLKADHPELQLVKLLEHPTIASLATWLGEAPTARVSIESAQDRARRQVEVLRRQRQRATRKE
ncbi:LLM class flavin-dependent oxidoreductase [Corallococcus sp. CA047B]|nr:MupA/Atu3671 family FMN-dependent luciferase-like monooxygenase [Corallococcus sp. CA047B]RKH21367.1 LLM class flavin-dependent oxidoreductase [Corallococcus sp. CA047B]